MYLSVLSYAVIGVLFGLTLLAAGRQLSRRLESEAAQRPFESGTHPVVHAWNRYHPRYLNLALVFLLSQTLLPFLFPWVVVARQSGTRGLAIVGGFLLLLLVGIVYAGREGVFEWD